MTHYHSLLNVDGIAGAALPPDYVEGKLRRNNKSEIIPQFLNLENLLNACAATHGRYSG